MTEAYTHSRLHLKTPDEMAQERGAADGLAYLEMHRHAHDMGRATG